jgi:hypothetical protein
MQDNERDGPFIKAATLCEVVIEDKSGVLSLIRVIDRVIQQVVGPVGDDTMPPIEHWSAYVVIMLVSGAARGNCDIGLTLEAPNGIRNALGAATVLLEGEDRGANIVIRAEFRLDLQGLYWIDVSLDGRRATRMPLRVVYSRLSPGSLPR